MKELLERAQRGIAGVIHVMAHGGMPPNMTEDVFSMFARFLDRGINALGVLQSRVVRQGGSSREIGLDVLEHG